MATPDLRDRKERGIASARAGQRLVARLQLERALESGLRDAELQLWLAWAADSPEKAISHLRSLAADRDYRDVAQSAMYWMEVLAKGLDAAANPWRMATAGEAAGGGLRPFGARDLPEVNLPEVPDPFAEYDRELGDGEDDDAASMPPQAAASPQAYNVACPHCAARLEVGPTALGRDRECPGCWRTFHVPELREGATAVLSPSDEHSVANGRPLESGPRILLIDDSAAIRQGGMMALNQAGYSVRLAAGAHDALDLVRRETPQLVLLDIHLGTADGYELCRTLRLVPALKSVPIILLTGNDGAFDAERGRRAGCTDHLAKPCETSALVAKVHIYVPSPVLSPQIPEDGP